MAALTGLACGAESAPAGVEKSIPSDHAIRAMIPAEVVYQNGTYTCTEETIAVQRVSPENLSLAGAATLATDAAVSRDPTPANPRYEVYKIAGTDPSQAIAIKFMAVSLSGKDGPYFTWLRYERKK